MTKYYLSNDFNQNFEKVIHKESCLYKPEPSEITYLGSFDDYSLALKESQKIVLKTNGCFWCCREIHSNNNLKIL